jgi:predicted alpha/beta-fold hydrolase
MNVDNIREMTERLLARYSDYDNAKAYFKDYTLLNNDLRDITLPTTIITAEDDPIIPVADFYDLHTSDATRLIVQPYGGHNGFLEGWRLNGWYEQVMADTFENAAISN